MMVFVLDIEQGRCPVGKAVRFDGALWACAGLYGESRSAEPWSIYINPDKQACCLVVSGLKKKRRCMALGF